MSMTRATRHTPGPDEDRLLRRYAETHDPELKAELSERFLPLARSLALRYRGTSEQLDDLFQVASLGLVKALDGFDPARGENFVAYAAPTILGELRRHFRDRVSDVRLPRGLQERAMAVSGAIRELSDEGGNTPTVSAIASRLDLSEEEVSEALQADEARRTLSLDAPGGPSRCRHRAARGVGGGGRAPATTRSRPSSPRRRRRSTSASALVLMLRFEDDLNSVRDRPPRRRIPDAGLEDHAKGAPQAARGGAGRRGARVPAPRGWPRRVALPSGHDRLIATPPVSWPQRCHHSRSRRRSALTGCASRSPASSTRQRAAASTRSWPAFEADAAETVCSTCGGSTFIDSTGLRALIAATSARGRVAAGW